MPNTSKENTQNDLLTELIMFVSGIMTAGMPDVATGNR